MFSFDKKRELRIAISAVALAVWLAAIAADSAAAYLNVPAAPYRVRGLTTDVPSRIAGFVSTAPQQVDVEPIEFPPASTDTDLVGIAYRRGSGDLYGIGSEGTVYVLTGAGPFAAVPLGPGPLPDPIASSNVGFAIDPATDLLRVLGGPAENLSFEPLNGSQLPGSPPLAYSSTTAGGAVEPHAGASPRVVAAGILDSNSLLGRRAYVIDAATNSLSNLSLDPAASGTLHTEGGLTLGPLTDAAGLGLPLSADLVHGNLGLLAAQKAGSGNSELCWLSLRDIYGKLGLVAKAGETAGCAPIAGPPLESLAIEPYSVVSFEGGDPARFEVTEGPYGQAVVARAGDLRRGVSVPWAAIAAESSKRFAHLRGSVVFRPGESRANLIISIPDDHAVEPVRHLTLEFAEAGGDGWVAGLPQIARVKVVDDELAAKFLRRKPPTLARTLRAHRLALPFRCSQRCDYFAVLYAGGRKLTTSISHSGASGRGTLVFRLRAPVRARMRAATGAAGLRVRVWSGFESDWGGAVDVRRHFLLRR